MKQEIRILGVDDSPLTTDDILVVGTVYRGGRWMDGVLSTRVTRDGLDATQKIIEMAGESKYYPQLRVIMLDGVTFAGFNVVDLPRLYGETGLPVIAVMRSPPDYEEIKKALENLSDSEERWRAIRRAGEAHRVPAYDDSIYIQTSGISLESAAEIVEVSATRSRVPEPVRAAHLIASGIILGESSSRV